MNKISVLIFFAASHAFACFAQEGVSLAADQADYDGKKITLQGNVSLEHDLGNIQAEQVVLSQSAPDKKTLFSKIKLENNIKLILRDGGELTCVYADIDYQTSQGKFYGGPGQDFVIYTDTCQGKQGKPGAPLLLKSKSMTTHIQADTGKNQTSHSFISDLAADQNVSLEYNNDFMAASDQAMYRRLQPENKSSVAMPGLISLRTIDKNGVCQITNRNGDLVKANQICIDTIKGHLSFAYPRGAIYTSREGNPVERVDFSADTLVWDEPNGVLTLRDRVVVTQKGIGMLKSEDNVKVSQKQAGGRRVLKSITAEGKSILSCLDKSLDKQHTLVCYGEAILDHENLESRLFSPKGAKGEIPQDKQVFFKDYLGEVYADKIKITYQYIDHEIKPKKIYMDGAVQIFNRYSGCPEITSRLVQYALAEHVEYDPETQEMLFQGSNTQRVLFYDKVNNLQVSAPGLKIKRDKESTKDTIEGQGDVRFNFAEHEFEQLRKRFQLQKNEKENKEQANI